MDREGCFERIFRHYSKQVFAYFHGKGFSREECDDLLQETFLRIYKGLAAFRREANFETWLYQISANVYKNHLRSKSTRKRHAPEVSLEQVLETSDGPEAPRASIAHTENPLASLMKSERSEVVHKALQELSPQMRRCVLLRVDQDLKYKEIADLMGISIETVKAHLFQARKQLKEKLGDEFRDLDI